MPALTIAAHAHDPNSDARTATITGEYGGVEIVVANDHSNGTLELRMRLVWGSMRLVRGSVAIEENDDPVAGLRAQNAVLIERLREYEMGEARAWALFDGLHGPNDLDNDIDTVVVVVGDKEDAQREADARNLAYIREHGQLPAHAVVHVPDAGTTIVWGDTNTSTPGVRDTAARQEA